MATKPPALRPQAGMEMPGWLDSLGRWINCNRNLCVKLGNLESRIYRHDLDDLPIDRPIFIAGLARSGSTILLELLASPASVATHRYRDFPPIFTPIFWNKAFGHIYSKNTAPVERSHQDRILVTPDSPEAMEEVLWMHFFDWLHDHDRSNRLDRTTNSATFERFFLDHIQKILLIRGGSRYLSKGNYNLTRLAYLAKLFPDARFIVPIRDPAWHTASLIKQHRLFCEEETRDPRILAHMQRVGHFEFGLDRRVINIGDQALAASIQALWQEGDEIRGWARYWSSLYGFVHDQMADDADLAKSVMVVRYEDLCAEPDTMIARILRHVELSVEPPLLERLAGRLSLPAYYTPDFSAEESAVIAEETAATASCYGYGAA